MQLAAALCRQTQAFHAVGVLYTLLVGLGKEGLGSLFEVLILLQCLAGLSYYAGSKNRQRDYT